MRHLPASNPCDVNFAGRNDDCQRGLHPNKTTGSFRGGGRAINPPVIRRWPFGGIVLGGLFLAGLVSSTRELRAQDDDVDAELPRDAGARDDAPRGEAGDAGDRDAGDRDAGVERCALPRAVIDRAGRCCLPGQTWRAGGCEGAPTSCAPGETHGEAGACVARAAVPQPDGSVLRRVRFDDPSAAGVPATMAAVPGGVIRADGRWIELGPFAIDRTEVSAGQYRRCVDAGVCDAATDPFGQMVRPELPAVNVTHAMALRYCGWAGGRLPTSAEWLLAARGYESRAHPWGDRLAGCDLARLAGCGDGAAPVGANRNDRSEFGVLDAAGNVSEWVLDRGPAPRGGGPLARDPCGSPRGDRAIVRGGSFTATPAEARLDLARYADVREARVDRGFRCARGL